MKKKKHNCAQDLPLHLSEHCAAKENLPLPLFKRYYPSWVLTIQHTAIPTVIIMRLTFTFNAQSLVNLFCILFHNFCFFSFQVLTHHLHANTCLNPLQKISRPWNQIHGIATVSLWLWKYICQKLRYLIVQSTFAHLVVCIFTKLFFAEEILSCLV